MSNINLSFCVPTYGRSERISKIIEQFSILKSDEIELVIGDDNPKSNLNKEKLRNPNSYIFPK